MLNAIMGNTLAKSAAIDFGIQFAGWAVASVFQTEKFYDLTGSATFLLLTYLSFEKSKKFLRQQIQSGMVATWTVRLGFYLISRVLKEGGDRRFDKIKTNPSYFLVVWTIQGVWVFMSLLPTLIQNYKTKDQELSTRDYCGYGLWIIGFLFEVIADYQKSAFRSNPDNAGKFIQHGLWSISRHPNYFGEILMWSGLFLSASSTFKGYEFLSVLSPIFITFLLTKVSGVPMLEASAKKRWGDNPAFKEYVKNTAVLIPFLY